MYIHAFCGGVVVMRLSPLGACEPCSQKVAKPAGWNAVKEMLMRVAAPVAVREYLIREDFSGMWVGGRETLCG